MTRRRPLTRTAPSVPTERTLVERVAELEQLVASLTDGTAELTVRRLAVADEHGEERIYTDVGDGYAELRVSCVGADRQESAAVMAAADHHVDGAPGGRVDIFLSTGGNVSGWLCGNEEIGGWETFLMLERPCDAGPGVELSADGTAKVRRLVGLEDAEDVAPTTTAG